ncbi:phage protease [Catenuloplanes indicus]|uniref:2'-5' RNA ligase n=1 Tax=Catenuloplanes indicus TaxID=137267 RepID=A0AAE4B4L9_9ACTN|nr:phage protease [Catenuloplanes indicus]MDQ0371600.1 2'-5' RNA ligase [Catenuloplanes indicus]MDQ0371613.1 2'-5' RNA ligase [Catenuloplanes indicus]
MTAPTVDLARREGVELVRTGRWETMTGSWTPTAEDIAAAVDAQSCPAIRKPVVKLGHTDARFAVGDGEPALGWFENLRATDGGSTLVGDQVTLPWLHSVQAAAYPSRSIEGNYNHRCGAGHVHKFVLTAVALLGVTPPAVKTIRNLNDLPGMLGVAASDPDVPEGAERVQVTIMARRRAEDFDEGSTKRDAGGRFSRVDTNDGPEGRGASSGGSRTAGGSGSSGSSSGSAGGSSPKPAAPLKDSLKIGDRIQLRDGETLAGGAQVDGTEGVVKVAVVDSPTGRRLHIGLNPPEVDDGDDDLDSDAAESDDDSDDDEVSEPWSGNQDEWTTVLDETGIGALHAALPQMLDMGRQGAEHQKSLEKRGSDLEKRERALINSQYPGLNAAGKKELQKIDVRSADVSSRLNQEQERAQRRIEELRPEDRQRVARAEPGEARGAYREAYLAAHPGEEKTATTYSFLYAQGLEKQGALSAERQALEARRSELTGDPQPLTPEAQAELAEVRDAIRRNDGEIGDFLDESYLTDGVVSGEWGDLVYQAVMTDSGPRYSLSLRPPGAPADWEPDDGSAAVDFNNTALKKLGALLDKVVGSSSVQAAAEVHTGAMVALIPTPEDAARLAVGGGEPAEQLHVTLAYLGEAADLGVAGQQDVIDAVSAAANGLPVIEAEAFAPALFNPGDASDRDPCAVLLLSGEWLDIVHSLVAGALYDAPMPDQHRPWIPHLTARYADGVDALAALAERVGPVRFDRLRIAFAGQTLDIPLIGSAGPDEPLDEAEAVAAAAGSGKSLKSWWLHGPGLKKWKSWTDLYKHLRTKVDPAFAKRIASEWFHERYGYWPGDKRNRKVAAAAEPTILPAAEPDPSTPEEDMVSTLHADLRARLGLADDADEQAMLTALDALKSKADSPQPTPEMVAASAAATDKAEKAEAANQVMKEELAKVRDELNTIKASAAQTVKASFFDGLLATGRLKPADRATWEDRYDRDSEMVTDILGGRGEGSEVPVMASGHTGPAEPDADTLDSEYEQLVSAVDAPTRKAA